MSINARTCVWKSEEYKCFQATIDANSFPGSLSYPERTLGKRLLKRKGSCLNDKNHSLWLQQKICGLKQVFQTVICEEILINPNQEFLIQSRNRDSRPQEVKVWHTALSFYTCKKYDSRVWTVQLLKLNEGRSSLNSKKVMANPHYKILQLCSFKTTGGQHSSLGEHPPLGKHLSEG